jgi:type II secretory pathway pseudopilin PulG
MTSLPASAKRRKPGFTVLELLLVVGIGAVTLTSVAPFAGRFRKTQELESYAQNVLVAGLRYAQSNALKQQNNSAWGVYFDHTDPFYVVYAGNSYATRTATLDRITRLPAGFTFSGTNDIPFAKGTGKTPGGTVTLTNMYGSRTITIGTEGVSEIPSSSAASTSSSDPAADLSLFLE